MFVINQNRLRKKKGLEMPTRNEELLFRMTVILFGLMALTESA